MILKVSNKTSLLKMIMHAMINTWRNLQIFAHTPLLQRFSLINIGTTVILAISQVVQDVVQFVPEDAIKVIKLYILERVISSVTAEIQVNAKV